MAYIVTASQFNNIRDESWLSVLRDINICHVEQLASLLLSSTGRLALKELNLTIGLEELEKATDQYLQQVNLPSLRTSRTATEDRDRPRKKWPKRGLGHLCPSYVQTLGFHEEISLENMPLGFLDSLQATPSDKGAKGESSEQEDIDFETLGFSHHGKGHSRFSVYPVARSPQVKDQRYRGTCVAFATTAMLEAFIFNHDTGFLQRPNFSEQYLYYRAKTLDPDKAEDGTNFSCAFQALSESGICPEADLPYRGYNDWSHSLLFEAQSNREDVDKVAREVRLEGYCRLPLKNLVSTIKECIQRKLAVGVGVLVFQDAWYNDFSVLRGEIQLPIIVQDEGKSILMDTCTGAHAVAIYGYQDDDDPQTARPGGGVFIFRNSWGEDWATANDQRGYGVLPYAYIERFCIDAYIVTKLRYERSSK